MKIEYLADGSPDCPLIRLYEFNQAEAKQLRQLVRSLVPSDRQGVELENEAWAEPLGGCRLALRCGNPDQGIRQVGSRNFECVLNSDGWRNVEGLLGPFCDSNTAGFQWLIHDGGVSLLISQNGHW